MRALELEGEADAAALSGSEGLTPGLDGALADAVVRARVGEDGGRFDRIGPVGGIDGDVLGPGHAAAGGEEEHVWLPGEVLDGEFFVGHGEVVRTEALDVGHAGALDVAGAPARVDEFPFAVIDANRVPGVAGVVGGEGGSGFDRCVAIALAVAANDDTFETGVGG